MKVIDRWKPVTKGAIYCSPACGAGCTKAEYLKAHRDGKILAKKCGPGYTSDVSENMAWHYNAVSASGHVKVHEYKSKGERSYTAFLGEADCPGGLFTCTAPTPADAIAGVIERTAAHIHELKSWLRGTKLIYKQKGTKA